MGKISSAVFGVVLLLSASIASADDPCRESRAMHPGDVAECVGVLVPQLWAKDCTNCLSVDLRHCEIEYESLEDTGRVERRVCTEKLQASRDAINQISRAIDRVAAPPWYESPVLWGAAGLFIGAGTTIGIVYVTR